MHCITSSSGSLITCKLYGIWLIWDTWNETRIYNRPKNPVEGNTPFPQNRCPISDLQELTRGSNIWPRLTRNASICVNIWEGRQIWQTWCRKNSSCKQNRQCHARVKSTPHFRPKWSKSIPIFRPKPLKNHTLWGRTCLYSPSKGVTPGPQTNWHVAEFPEIRIK